MIRKTLTILSLIGLLFSVAAWGVSYWGVEYTKWTDTSLSQYRLAWGGIDLIRVDQETLRQLTPSSFPQPGVIRRRGFNGWRTIWRPHYKLNRYFYGSVVLPFWPLAMIFGSTLWVTWRPLRSYRRRKRKKLGLCLKCGYDLRGSKGRCPECGEAMA